MSLYFSLKKEFLHVLTPRNNLPIFAREPRRRGIRCRSAPKVIRGISQEVLFLRMEEGRFPAIAFREYDFVEEFDRGIVGTLGFAFVDEFVEA